MKNTFNYSGFCKKAYSPLRNANTETEANNKTDDSDNLSKHCPPYLMTTTPTRHNKAGE